MPEPSPPRMRRRAAKLFLAWLIIGGMGLAVWQVVMPTFAPQLLSANSQAVEQDRAAGETPEMSSRLARALERVTRTPAGERWDQVAMATGEGDALDDAWMEQDPGLRRMLRGGAANDRSTRNDEAEEAQAAMAMAEHLLAQGEYAEAQALLRRALEFAPNDAQARYKLGLSCVMERDFAAARAELKELRKLDPSLASLLSNLVPKS